MGAVFPTLCSLTKGEAAAPASARPDFSASNSRTSSWIACSRFSGGLVK